MADDRSLSEPCGLGETGAALGPGGVRCPSCQCGGTHYNLPSVFSAQSMGCLLAPPAAILECGRRPAARRGGERDANTHRHKGVSGHGGREVRPYCDRCRRHPSAGHSSGRQRSALSRDTLPAVSVCRLACRPVIRNRPRNPSRRASFMEPCTFREVSGGGGPGCRRAAAHSVPTGGRRVHVSAPSMPSRHLKNISRLSSRCLRNTHDNGPTKTGD